MSIWKHSEGSPVPQPQDQDPVEVDLQDVYATCKRLVLAYVLPRQLHDLMEQVARGIRGCSSCHAMLGEHHRCRLLAGCTVQACDLDQFLVEKTDDSERPF